MSTKGTLEPEVNIFLNPFCDLLLLKFLFSCDCLHKIEWWTNAVLNWPLDVSARGHTLVKNSISLYSFTAKVNVLTLLLLASGRLMTGITGLLYCMGLDRQLLQKQRRVFGNLAMENGPKLHNTHPVSEWAFINSQPFTCNTWNVYGQKEKTWRRPHI